MYHLSLNIENDAHIYINYPKIQTVMFLWKRSSLKDCHMADARFTESKVNICSWLYGSIVVPLFLLMLMWTLDELTDL